MDGSVEALTDSLLKLSTENIKVNAIHSAVGPIAVATCCSPPRPTPSSSVSSARIGGAQVAETGVYRHPPLPIIYNAIEEPSAFAGGHVALKEEERKIMVLPRCANTFKDSSRAWYGCYVLDGIARQRPRSLIRDGIVIYTGGSANWRFIRTTRKR